MQKTIKVLNNTNKKTHRERRQKTDSQQTASRQGKATGNRIVQSTPTPPSLPPSPLFHLQTGKEGGIKPSRRGTRSCQFHSKIVTSPPTPANTEAIGNPPNGPILKTAGVAGSPPEWHFTRPLFQKGNLPRQKPASGNNMEGSKPAYAGRVARSSSVVSPLPPPPSSPTNTIDIK